MMTWTATLPQRMNVSGFQEAMGDGRKRSQTEAGPAKMRKRISFPPRPVTCTCDLKTAQIAILEAFMASIGAGTAPFLFPNQRGAGTWTVQIGENMPSWVPLGGDWWRLSMELVILR